mmetsp:Transcript_127236/g.354264  ORF Transcript_127236/g.354264 Transcript_127236/m.354264 type:complete len:308 (+) Transcript_127236:335-1258(+)
MMVLVSGSALVATSSAAAPPASELAALAPTPDAPASPGGLPMWALAGLAATPSAGALPTWAVSAVSGAPAGSWVATWTAAADAAGVAPRGAPSSPRGVAGAPAGSASARAPDALAAASGRRRPSSIRRPSSTSATAVTKGCDPKRVANHSDIGGSFCRPSSSSTTVTSSPLASKSAPQANSTSRASTLRHSAAQCAGVRPNTFLALRFAQACASKLRTAAPSRNSSLRSGFPRGPRPTFLAAVCAAVSPALLPTSTSAPRSANALMASRGTKRFGHGPAAYIMAVDPKSSTALRSPRHSPITRTTAL